MRLGGAVGDRQVLDRDGVPVFETAVTDPAAGQVPAPADGLNGFDRADIPLGQPIERVTPGRGRRYERQLLDAEILGLALELHRLMR